MGILPQPMISPSSLLAIARELEQHQDAPRIKKLLIYTAENRWESNLQQLQRFPIEIVIHKIVMQFPAIDQLQQALDVAVSTLSRPAAYSVIASEILAYLSPLYEDTEDATKIVLATPSLPQGPAVSTLLIETIAHTLETSREGIRIKKLLYALCYKRWENNFQILGQTTFVQLIQQVATLCTTYTQFQDALLQLVSSLNRQNVYAQIAEFMSEAIAPLYGSGEGNTGITRPMLNPLAMQTTLPTSSENYKTTLETGKESASARVEPEDHPDNTAINTFGHQQFQKIILEDDAPETSVYVNKSVTPTPASKPTPPSTPQHFADNLNFYELKLEVMKYANPLRAKILLFSALHHPFDLSGQDWAMLRTCDLDDLLRKSIKSAPTIVALEIKLSAIAQSLFEPQEHLQTTSAIIQAINVLTTTT